MRILSTLMLAITIPSLLLGFSDEANKKAMYNDLNFIQSVFEAKYAPTAWKKSCYGWDFDKEIQLAKANIASIPQVTLKDYQRELRRVLNSTKDYHVSALFCSTEAAFLPFGVRSAGNKYYISSLNSKDAPKGLSVGDELVAFDGKNVQDAINELKTASFDDATPETDQMMAEEFLTSRFGRFGAHVPQGICTITVQPKGTKEVRNYTLNWHYIPEMIESFQESDYESSPSDLSPLAEVLKSCSEREMVMPLYHSMKKISADASEQEKTLGSKKSFVPQLGNLIWEAKANLPFHAYIFELDDHKVGYVRIPSYQEDEECAKVFMALISKFEKTTDALVIDQVNNPGGYVLYSYALLSMLTDRPLHIPTHQFALTQEDVLHAYRHIQLMEELKGYSDFGNQTVLGYPLSKEFFQSMVNFYQFIINEWKSKRYLTDHFHESGIDRVLPHTKVHYTKPILFLVNSLDFSGGDFVPAILQDNQRATIFGTRTAGAGGIVHSFSYPNRFGIDAIGLTKSLAKRSNNQPLENLGVQPDVVYELTEYDLQNNYSGYKEKVLDALETLIHKH